MGICTVFQQLEIDYVIGENNKELMPNSSGGAAAILRIFGVTQEGAISLSFKSLIIQNIIEETLNRH